MDKKLAEKIVQLAQNVFDDPGIKVIEDYSGRFMYGKKTCAVKGLSSTTLCVLIIESANEFVGECNEPLFPCIENGFSVDELGLDPIIY